MFMISNNDKVAIELINVCKKYKNEVVLKNVNYQFLKGKRYLLIGSNGSGKSTLIKLILRINNIDNGVINVYSNSISYIPEKNYFPSFGKIRDYFNNIKDIRKFDSDLFIELTKIFNLDINKKISQLSKGQLQKVLLIQGLVFNSELIILDEPLNGLDKSSQNVLFCLLNKMQENKTIIICTHYPDFYKTNFDYVLEMRDGVIND